MSYQDALALLKNLKHGRSDSAKSAESRGFGTFGTPRPGPCKEIEAPEKAPGDSPEVAGATPCRDASDTAGAYQRTPQAVWDAADWRAHYDERAAIREYDGRRPRAEAERLAWGEMQNEWHRLHGERSPAWQCAGCRKPIGGQPVFAFPDGARAHDSLTCIAAYGERWRSAATAALVAMGLPRPASVPEDEP